MFKHLKSPPFMISEIGINHNSSMSNVKKLINLAKKYNLQNKCKEQLLKAYFIDGKNTADHELLTKIGINIGLNETEITETLNSNLYANEVNEDIYHAQQVGVKGVPFFVFGNKYAISGAQEPETFLGALQKASSL